MQQPVGGFSFTKFIVGVFFLFCMTGYVLLIFMYGLPLVLVGTFLLLSAILAIRYVVWPALTKPRTPSQPAAPQEQPRPMIDRAAEKAAYQAGHASFQGYAIKQPQRTDGPAEPKDGYPEQAMAQYPRM